MPEALNPQMLDEHNRILAHLDAQVRAGKMTRETAGAAAQQHYQVILGQQNRVAQGLPPVPKEARPGAALGQGGQPPAVITDNPRRPPLEVQIGTPEMGMVTEPLYVGSPGGKMPRTELGRGEIDDTTMANLSRPTKAKRAPMKKLPPEEYASAVPLLLKALVMDESQAKGGKIVPLSALSTDAQTVLAQKLGKTPIGFKLDPKNKKQVAAIMQLVIEGAEERKAMRSARTFAPSGPARPQDVVADTAGAGDVPVY